jgi:ribonuclease PH
MTIAPPPSHRRRRLLELAVQIRATLEAAVFVALVPKAELVVNVEVLQLDGSGGGGAVVMAQV